MLKKFLTSAMSGIALLMATGCAHVGAATAELPTQSFVQIYRSTNVILCAESENNEPPECTSNIRGPIRSTASGVLVKNWRNNSFLFTAGHFCESFEMSPSDVPPWAAPFPVAEVKFEDTFTIIDIDGNEHTGIVLNYDMSIDACFMSSDIISKRPVGIASRGANPTEEVWNLAAPLGVYYTGTVPTFRGYYAGIGGPNGGGVYTDLPVAPGSSGSMILIQIGGEYYLTGLVHSVDTRLPEIAYGVTHSQLVEFYEISWKMYTDSLPRLVLIPRAF